MPAPLIISDLAAELVSRSAWNATEASSFYAGSPLADIVFTAGQQANAIPNLQFYKLVVVTRNGIRGVYGPVTAEVVSSFATLATNCCGLDIVQVLSAWEEWDRRLRLSGVSSQAIGALNCALWDIKSRASGRAISAELGGPTLGELECYASFITVDIDGPATEQIAELATTLGFWGQKWALPEGPTEGTDGLRRNLRRIERIREAVGNGPRIMIEARLKWDFEYYTAFCSESHALKIDWIEEPFTISPDISTSRLDKASIPIAAGERCTTLRELETLLMSGCVSIVQPDVIVAGGLETVMACRKLAGAHKAVFAPHGRSLVPALHIAALKDNRPLTVMEFNPLLEAERQTAMGIRIPLNKGRICFSADDWIGLWPRALF